MATADQEIVKRALAILFQPGETIELRCLLGERIINGYYRDQAKLAQDACTMNMDFAPRQNCFVVLNPVDPQLYARRADQYGQAKKGEGTKDPEVVCRRWLLIDCDPIRPTGVSASEPQRAAAIKLAKAVHGYLLKDLHFPPPVCCDSGNGQHMLLPLADLPNDAVSQWACERFLTHLAERFPGKKCKVDTTTYNAARITALYGTCKRKGSDIAEAPHRLSFLRTVPDPIVPVSLEQLLAVVGPYPGDQHQAALAVPQQAGSTSWNIPQLLADRQVEYEQHENYQTASGERATRYTLEVCPFNEAHNDRSACLVQWGNGAIAFRCHHDGCTGRDWQALKALWGLPAGGGIEARDIVLPASQPIITPAPLPAASLEVWLDPPQAPPAAFYGPLGAICQGLAPDTEAVPIAVLACSLMFLGNVIGRRFYVQLDQWHYAKLYVALVGPTGSGRKGTADVQARRIIDAIDPTAEIYRHSGLTTGEGLLAVLNDNRDGMFPRPAAFIEREFAAVFRRAERRGNTLNSFIRDAWDNDTLENNSKGDPMRIADHHISICAHVTPAELKRLLSSLDVANGFANRFLWLFTRRSERRPNACGFRADRFSRELKHLQTALEQLKQRHNQAGEPLPVPLTSAARDAWRDSLYAQLDVDSEQDTQLVLMCNRQPQQVVRIALIFALAEGRVEIGLEHLHAARAIVEYTWDSLDYILSRPWWGDADNAQDPAGLQPKVLEALRAGPHSRWQIRSDVLHRHHTAKEINALRDLLVNAQRIQVQQNGRTEIWTLREI